MLALLLTALIFTLINSVFAEPRNLENISSQITYEGVIAVSMTYVIVTGEIDLSVGSMVAVSGRRLRDRAPRRAPDVGGDPRHSGRGLRARGGERDPQRPPPGPDDHHHPRDAQRLPRPRGPARERLSDLGLPRQRLVLGHRPEPPVRPHPLRHDRAHRLRAHQRLRAAADDDRPPRLRDGEQPEGRRARGPPRQPDPSRRAGVQRLRLRARRAARSLADGDRGSQPRHGL